MNLQSSEKELILNQLRKVVLGLDLKIDALQSPDYNPLLIAICELDIPQPISVGKSTYPMRFIPLDWQFILYSKINQLKEIKLNIQTHYNQNRGKIDGYGKIMHYSLYIKYEENEFENIKLFDTNGNYIDNPHKQMRRPYNKILRFSSNGDVIDHFF